MTLRKVHLFYCLTLAFVLSSQVSLLAPTPFYSTTSRVAASESLPLTLDPSSPYALVVGSYGRLDVFDGDRLFQFPTGTASNLTAVRWRHDGAYALAVGLNSTLLKITVSGGTVSVEPIISGLPKTFSLETVAWTADDSEALIASSRGMLLLYDGQKVTQVPSGIARPIFGADWSPTQHAALLAGQNGLIAEFTGNNVTISPHLTNFTLFAVRWDPSGSFALVGGDHAVLYMYQGVHLTAMNTRALFEVAPHLIRDIAFNQDGTGLIAGQLGLTVIFKPAKCDYNLFESSNRKCLTMTRLQYYEALNGTRVDLHRIGHFYATGWLPGTQFAYSVGTHATIARVTTSDVILLTQDRSANYSFRSIDWQPRIRAHDPPLFQWTGSSYMVAYAFIGLVATLVLGERVTSMRNRRNSRASER